MSHSIEKQLEEVKTNKNILEFYVWIIYICIGNGVFVWNLLLLLYTNIYLISFENFRCYWYMRDIWWLVAFCRKKSCFRLAIAYEKNPLTKTFFHKPGITKVLNISVNKLFSVLWNKLEFLSIWHQHDYRLTNGMLRLP